MISVFCECGGDKKIADSATEWNCSYCGANHKINIEEKLVDVVEKKVVEKKKVKKKKVKVKPKVENEDVRGQEFQRDTTTPDWGYKKEE